MGCLRRPFAHPLGAGGYILNSATLLDILKIGRHLCRKENLMNFVIRNKCFTFLTKILDNKLSEEVQIFHHNVRCVLHFTLDASILLTFPRVFVVQNLIARNSWTLLC